MRILQWKQSFFQVIVTLANKNHKIDRVLVEQTKNLIVMIDNKITDGHDTIIHVYRYSQTAGDSSGNFDLDIRRVQMLSTPIDLGIGNAFLYSSSLDSAMYMVFCAMNLPHSIVSHFCEYYVWRSDGIDDETAFQRMDHLDLLEKLPLQDLQLPLDQIQFNQQRILTTDDLLAFQINVCILFLQIELRLLFCYFRSFAFYLLHITGSNYGC